MHPVIQGTIPVCIPCESKSNGNAPVTVRFPEMRANLREVETIFWRAVNRVCQFASLSSVGEEGEIWVCLKVFEKRLKNREKGFVLSGATQSGISDVCIRIRTLQVSPSHSAIGQVFPRISGNEAHDVAPNDVVVDG
ncbi:hypothetical protein K0M31_002435 [Melipona bicolor]|uniref:Uncharacterized protein n=1 Tax=Melipona bicolor TaxID=60889 RepID=A0AA40KYV1_9HYME|nr:hypothetical protein K0M31_002435 [Melipona bicolor]